MKTLAALALPLLFAFTQAAEAAPAKRRAPARPAPAPEKLPDIVNVDINTELGTITVALDAKHAPISARNFIRYADQKRFDGIVFYRVMRLPWGEQPNGLVQAGMRGDPKRVLPNIAHEPTTKTGLLHKKGAISMARLAPGTANGDWSILVSDMPGLDADPASPDPNTQQGYAVFGYVASGMEVAQKIYDVPLSPTMGQGALKGQMIAKPVKVLTVRRSKLQPVAPAPQPAPAPPQ
jgi:peptidyl-prolyl cis-trans isomerase A (cyclophilin A)